MTKLADKIEPMDVMAMCMILGCIIGQMIKADPMFKEVAVTLVGFYFGRKTKT